MSEKDPNEIFRHIQEDRLLAIVLYGEARGEPIGGKVGVASVIMNRVKRGGWWGATTHDVILKPKQFSCFNVGDPNRLKLMVIAVDWDKIYQSNKALRECYRVAQGVLSGELPDNVMGATHYKTTSCAASWAASMLLVAELGNHQFYAEVKP